MHKNLDTLFAVTFDKRGLLSFPAFEIVYDTMEGEMQDRIRQLLENYIHISIPEAVIRKASDVAIGKDLNNFRYSYLGFEDDDEEIRQTFASMPSIRASVVKEMREAGSMQEMQKTLDKFKQEFNTERTAKSDLKRLVGELFLRVCNFEMLEQHFACLQQQGKLETEEPVFKQHFNTIINTPKGQQALYKQANGVQVDSL